jgi:GntR family transcriptional repressor for pyruvate dehydrogenase complex
MASPQDETSARHLEDDQLLMALLGRITSLKPGERLPSERSLAGDLSVNRTTLRDRLQSLESLGVLDRRTGSGTYVKAISPQTVSTVVSLGLIGRGLTIESLQPVRVALERQAAKEAAVRAAPGPMAIMATSVKRMDLTSDPHELYAADLDFHRALFEASNSPALIFFADALADVLARSVEQRRARMMQLAHDSALMREVHRVIYEAVLSGDEAASMEAVDNHFRTIDALALELPSTYGEWARS